MIVAIFSDVHGNLPALEKFVNSILNSADLSVLSFHGSKVSDTMKGGAIICHDERTRKRIDYLKDFGFADIDPVFVSGCGSLFGHLLTGQY